MKEKLGIEEGKNSNNNNSNSNQSEDISHMRFRNMRVHHVRWVESSPSNQSKPTSVKKELNNIFLIIFFLKSQPSCVQPRSFESI